MNANEVIAHLAGAHPGVHPGVHPNDHVNRGQSSNDVIPTAIHVAAAVLATEELLPALRRLASVAGCTRRVEFQDVVKIGRTHLQDAVPDAYWAGIQRLRAAGGSSARTGCGRRSADIYELPLGGTAVGTGLNAPPGFARGVIEELARRTGLAVSRSAKSFRGAGTKDAVVLPERRAAKPTRWRLTKIANDIRWLGSGPRCGIGELRLPAVQPGSSIMPGKVNPVIAESLLMVCAQVIGHDAAITWCVRRGQFRAERDDAGDGVRPARFDRTARSRRKELQSEVRGRSRSRSRAGGRFCRTVARDGYGARAGDRLREGRGNRERSVLKRPHGSRGRAGEERSRRKIGWRSCSIRGGKRVGSPFLRFACEPV